LHVALLCAGKGSILVCSLLFSALRGARYPRDAVALLQHDTMLHRVAECCTIARGVVSCCLALQRAALFALQLCQAVLRCNMPVVLQKAEGSAPKDDIKRFEKKVPPADTFAFTGVSCSAGRQGGPPKP
jgi:hypothetical protein